MRLKSFIYALALFNLLITWTGSAGAQEPQDDGQPKLRLVRAVMCESIEGFEPYNIAVAFSVNVGRISCFTSFADVPDVISVEHRWFRREELVTTKRLTIKPPSWATYSSIQLREADKGPWRVEIWEVDGPLYKTIRFSVTD